MTSISTNITTLKQKLSAIKELGKSYCITISAFGNLLYILNEGIGFYVLLVPNKKLTEQLSHQILQINGWTEKFALTNYHKSFELYSTDMIPIEIENIFINILKIPTTRKWCFDVNSGMMIVKDNVLALDAASRREINKARANSPLRKIIKLLVYPFSNNLRVSITWTIILNALIVFNNRLMNTESNYKIFLLTIVMGLLFYVGLRLKFPDRN